MIISPTLSLLRTDRDIYRHVCKAIANVTITFAVSFPLSIHPSLCVCLSAHMKQLKLTKQICVKIDIADLNKNLLTRLNFG
jgi:hypothetical protein